MHAIAQVSARSLVSQSKFSERFFSTRKKQLHLGIERRYNNGSLFQSSASINTTYIIGPI